MQAAGHGSLANHDQVGEPPLVRENIWVPVEGCGGLPGPTGTQRLNPCQKDSWLKDSLPKGFDLNPCQKDGSLTHKGFVQLSHCQNYFFKARAISKHFLDVPAIYLKQNCSMKPMKNTQHMYRNKNIQIYIYIYIFIYLCIVSCALFWFHGIAQCHHKGPLPKGVKQQKCRGHMDLQDPLPKGVSVQ